MQASDTGPAFEPIPASAPDGEAIDEVRASSRLGERAAKESRLPFRHDGQSILLGPATEGSLGSRHQRRREPAQQGNDSEDDDW